MKIGYCSDLHLEFGVPFDFSKEKGGDICLLVGDTTTAYAMDIMGTDPRRRSQKKLVYKTLKTLSKKFDRIYYLMGNHEHYHSDFIQTKGLLHQSFTSKDLDIKIFDNNNLTVQDGWTFIGSTLWTDYQRRDPNCMELARQSMNDYIYIKYNSGIITPSHLYNECVNSLDYLDRYTRDKDKVIVFTHMPPSFKSINPEHTSATDGAYASDFSEFILNRPQIKYWIHGHTHKQFDYHIGDTRILANSRGYYFENSFKEFTGLHYIEV